MTLPKGFAEYSMQYSVNIVLIFHTICAEVSLREVCKMRDDDWHRSQQGLVWNISHIYKE